MPKLQTRKSAERGHANHGWLDTYHTFSFADYYDGRFMNFGPLRVLNEDRVKPNHGFGTHPHREYEIFSYIISGTLEHKDSLGHTEQLPRGTIQHTSAGTGLSHSEYNADKKKTTVHFLQLWLKPAISGLEPSYVTKKFDDEEKVNKLLLVLYPDPSLGAVSEVVKRVGEGADVRRLIPTHADAFMFASILEVGKTVTHKPVGSKRRTYVHVTMRGNGGKLNVNGGEVVLEEGDGLFVTDIHEKEELVFTAEQGVVEFIVLDMA